MKQSLLLSYLFIVTFAAILSGQSTIIDIWQGKFPGTIGEAKESF